MSRSSEGLGSRLDVIARFLAEPMPRRRVIRLFGVAVGAAVVPGALARRAMAQSKSCPDPARPVLCSAGPSAPFSCCRPLSETCCAFPSSATCCAVECKCGKDERGFAKCTCPRCPKGTAECGKVQCCGQDEDCVSVPAGSTRVDVCVPKCRSGQSRCGEKCCPKGQRCANARTGACSPCPAGRTSCGPKCCPAGSMCCDRDAGLCCNKKTQDCGGYGGTGICCPKGRDVCESSPGSNRPVCCRPGHECANVADESGTIPPALRGKQTCCPPDRLVPQPGTCCPQGYKSLGGKLVIPSGGGGGLCCREDKICGSGKTVTCCSTGSRTVPELEQICCGSECVAFKYDRQNCGACGKACAPGERCNQGTCVPA